MRNKCQWIFLWYFCYSSLNTLRQDLIILQVANRWIYRENLDEVNTGLCQNQATCWAIIKYELGDWNHFKILQSSCLDVKCLLKSESLSVFITASNEGDPCKPSRLMPWCQPVDQHWFSSRGGSWCSWWHFILSVRVSTWFPLIQKSDLQGSEIWKEVMQKVLFSFHC